MVRVLGGKTATYQVPDDPLDVSHAPSKEVHDEIAAIVSKIFSRQQDDAEKLGYKGFDLGLQWYDNPFVGELRLFRRWRYGWERRRTEVFRERNEKLFA